jgi:hypothetical protein
MNIYHEFGHLLDSKNVYTRALENVQNPSYITGEGGLGYVNQNALIKVNVTTDPNYKSVYAIQASKNGVSEQWADIFANYVAGNIDLSDPLGPGMQMYNFVTGALGTP